jgi:dTDP-4-amino-4,6-dideoxygalactose transaminase
MTVDVSYAEKTLVPLVDLKAQSRALQPRIQARLRETLSACQFILGPEVAELENELASFSGARHAICVASGTDALKISLMTERLGPGDAVLVPSFTFVATAEAVASLGATPVFVDIDKETFNLDPDDLLRRLDNIKDDRRLRPRAIIAVDLFGLPADYPAINEIAAHYGLLVVADAAQSFGGSISGQRVGCLAPVTAVSFYPSKPLGCYGDGGCLLTDDDERAAIMRSIHRHGVDSDDHTAIHVGMNSRLDTLQAAILLTKLEVFEEELKARNHIAQCYGSKLRSIAAVPKWPARFSSAWALYSILVRDRDRVRDALAKEGIATGIYYSVPLHLQPAYAGYGEGRGSLPVSEGVSEQILSLPMHPYLDEETIDRICRTTLRAL